jgi:hypothetical protein
VPDSVVSDKRREAILNAFIDEIIVYKDAAAAVINKGAQDYYLIRYLSREDGRWLNAGEDMASGLEEARRVFTQKAGLLYDFTKRIPVLSRVPADAAPFASYLRSNAREPRAFVLEALADHRLVVYGEIHRRQWSWDFWRSVVNDQAFAETTGTIYMEISAHKQSGLDAFLAKESLDPEFVLDAFREVQAGGWPDKGMFEFLCEIWRVNRNLPESRRIKVFAVDIPRPFGTFRTANEMKRYFESSPNRNAFMTEAVEKDVRSGRDSRHGLFIVGTGHAYKSTPPGFASSAAATEIPSAGSLLASRLPRGSVYTIFSHQAIISNNGSIGGRLRGGAFDEAFALAGNAPTAFAVAGSPFGREPFDALPEISYRTAAGTYADNYDGYVFLGPLDDEPADYMLTEIYSADFIHELSRRASLDGSTLQKWFRIAEATPEAVIAKVRSDTEGKRRWAGLPAVKAAAPRR